MISVIIATKNRPGHLRRCLVSLGKSTYRRFEVIVADQSEDTVSVPETDTLGIPSLIHIHVPYGGKSEALNRAVALSNGSSIAFTDDDCIVRTDWLDTIHAYLSGHPDAAAVFGSTYPYQKARHKGEYCPSTYMHNRSHRITRFAYHATKIGFGNNMAIRKTAFERTGGFRTWLGPGTVGMAAEDAEIELRLLQSGFSLAYEKSIRIFHNRWLSPRAFRIQNLAYALGECACYGYYAFQGYPFAASVIKKQFAREFRILLKSTGPLIRRRWTRTTLGTWYWQATHILYRMRGLIIGAWHSRKDPLT